MIDPLTMKKSPCWLRPWLEASAPPSSRSSHHVQVIGDGSERCIRSRSLRDAPQHSRICCGLEALIASLLGSHDGSRVPRRSNRSTSTSMPISMCCNIGAGRVTTRPPPMAA